MRIFFIITIVFCLIWTIFRSWRSSGKPNWIIVAIIGFPLLFISWGEYKWQTNEAVGTEVVVQVSGNKDGVLKCQRLSEALFDASVATKGMVYFAEPDEATVKYNTCQDLFGWMDSNRQSATLMETQAIGVMIHEAVHVSGEFNESITECISMKKMANVLVSLGTEKPNAELIASTYRNEIHTKLSSQYLGGKC